MVLEKFEPKHVWDLFENLISKTPRPSKHEEKIRQAILKWVEKLNIKNEKLGIKEKIIDVYQDTIGNILLSIPSSPGLENKPSILFQAHMDMVCETNKPDGFDFNNNPIPIKIDETGEWVEADGTTLGADDGVGLALCLGLIIDKDPDFKHGPIEILLTVDEETGLTGAFELDLNKIPIKSKVLVNVDSEDLGIITIGSAGGGRLTWKKKFKKNQLALFDKNKMIAFQIEINGLKGGHSGVDIDKFRANANELLSQFMIFLLDSIDFYLISWNGGDKTNAITRSAKIIIAIEKQDSDETEKKLEEYKEILLKYYKNGINKNRFLEPNIEINIIKSTYSKDETLLYLVDKEETKKIISSISNIPQGIIRMSPTIPELVETSNNLAVMKTILKNISDSDFVLNIELKMSERSSHNPSLSILRKRLGLLGELSGWDVEYDRPYPGWQPQPELPFIQFVKEKYEKILGKKVKMEAIHAGLETGLLGGKIRDLQMVSIGPTIKNPHTPDEKIRIQDMAILYKLLKELAVDYNNFF